MTVYISPSVNQRTKKESSPIGTRLCRKCLSPLADEAALPQHHFMHQACFLQNMAEYRARIRDESDEPKLEVFDVSKLKSPFDILDTLGDWYQR